MLYGRRERHAPSTIKSLLRRGWLEGNSYGVKVAIGDKCDTSTWKKAKLWISAKGKTLIEEIAIESGWVFDKDHYVLIKNRDEYRVVYRSMPPKEGEEKDGDKDSIELGTFDDWLKASLACDQAAILLCGDDAPIEFPEFPHRQFTILSDEVIRQISALKEVDRPTVLAKLKEAGLLDFL